MKQALAIAGFLCIMTVAAVAQPNKVLSAYNYLQEQEWAAAIENIEPATKHEKTADKAKTWFYRGLIYHGLYESKNEADKNIDADPLPKAVRSYIKARSLDTRRIDANRLDHNLQIGGQQLVGVGIGHYNDKNYTKALESFELATQVSDIFGKTDSLALYNAALAAEKADKPEDAIKYYQKCIDVKYGGAKVYYFLANLYGDQGNDEKFNAVLTEGRSKYPNDQSLVTAQINVFLKNDDSQAALEALDVAINNDPENQSLFFARGTIYEKLDNTEKAMADYNKAVEIDPDYFDAWYNMGALYFNNGVDKVNKANELPTSEQKKYDALKAEADADFKKALPFLEKAEKLNPEDKNTLMSLKELYLRTKNNDGYMRVKAKLEN